METRESPPVLGDEFYRETGELTIRRWQIGMVLYLVFTVSGAVVEGRLYPERIGWLVFGLLAQVGVVIGAWRTLERAQVHPATARIVLRANLAICGVIALHNAAVDGDMLYALLAYLAFMVVSCLFLPWGVGYQLALNGGIIVFYILALAGGAHTGHVPAYDYLGVVAYSVLSALGASYVDQYRRQLFGKALALRQANARLEAASAARSDLLGGLSHDMRTPLSVLIGYADILSEADLPELLRQAAHSIRRESHQLLALVDSVVDLARLEKGQLPFQRSVFKLAAVLDPLRETSEDQLRDRGIALRWEVPDEIMVDSDAGKVREIVRNLLSNAVKYTERGEIAVAARSAAGGVEITVTDSGVGIEPHNLEHIFAPFRRLDGDTSDATRGVGFGLYLVSLLVRLLGARIEVSSRPHRGSTFRLRLPPQPPAATAGLGA